MAQLYGSGHTLLVMLLVAALSFVSVMFHSYARPVPYPIREEDRKVREFKSMWELSGRDEMVQIAGYGEEKLSTVLVSGAVFCQRICLKASYELPPQPISGALVGLTCQTNKTDKSRSTGAQVVTDKGGEFTIDLPSELHAILDLDKACSLKVLRSPKNSTCRLSDFVGNHQGIRLSSVENGIRTYAAGTMTFRSMITKSSKICTKRMGDSQKCHGRCHVLRIKECWRGEGCKDSFRWCFQTQQ